MISSVFGHFVHILLLGVNLNNTFTYFNAYNISRESDHNSKLWPRVDCEHVTHGSLGAENKDYRVCKLFIASIKSLHIARIKMSKDYLVDCNGRISTKHIFK